MSAATKISRPMTVAEFLAWNPEDGQSWQLVDGEPQAMAPARNAHAALMIELGAVLRNHFIERDSPCIALGQPGIVPHVNARRNYRVPDLAVTCTGYDAEEYTIAAPVLVVEILSPGNTSKTWANVWTYTSIPSVREILILHTAGIGADLLRRLPDQSWPKEPEAVTSGDLSLESIAFRIPLRALYRTTPFAAS
jgi:Uma2 family endonuclease